jgi:hypothetical protein
MVGNRGHAGSLVGALALLYCVISARVVTATVIGFDSAFTSSSSPFAVTECDAACSSPSTVTLQLQLTRTGSLAATDTVLVSTRSSTVVNRLSATATDDYVPLTNVIVIFSPSEASKIVAITIVSDGIYEEDEYFEAVVASPSTGVTLLPSTQVAYVRIQDGGDGT